MEAASKILRKELKSLPKRIVLKVGSLGVTGETGVDKARLASLSNDIIWLLKNKVEVILVSSGAIQVGRAHLRETKSEDINTLQAMSAIGQPLLMAAYQGIFQKKGVSTSQVLLTHEDLGNRKRNLNLRNTLLRLLEFGVLPIVNENDSVSTAEISVGDNDQLAAMVAEATMADLLVLLTGPDGLYTCDPEKEGAKKLTAIDPEDLLEQINTKGRSGAGRGGMKTKLDAVRRVTPLGIPVVISSYKAKNPIRNALSGGGSYFGVPKDTKKTGKKRWLVSSAKQGAKIKVDKGAYLALKKGASLLPSGIKSLEGLFRRGDLVTIYHQNKIIGHGLSEYSIKELTKIKGKKSSEIEAILGHYPSKVVIHRNHLALKE